VSGALEPPRSSESRAWYRGLAALVLLAGVQAGVHVWAEPNIGSDALLYLVPIHNLVAGKGYTYMGEPQILMPPGYGVLAYLVFLVVGDIELSGMLVSAISAVLVPVIVFAIVTRLAGSRAGWIAAFLVTCWPTMVKYAHVNYSDLAFTLFLSMGALLYTKAVLDGTSPVGCVLLGGVLGFGVLIRPEGALVAVLALGSLLFLASPRGAADSRPTARSVWRRLTLAGTAAIVAALVVAPYVAFLHRETGRWTLSTKLAVNLAVGEGVVDALDEGEEATPAEERERERVDLLDYIGSQGTRMLVRVWRNARLEVGQLIKITLHGLLLAAVVAACAVRWLGVSRAWKVLGVVWRVKPVVMFAVFMSPLPAYPLFFIADRFLMPYAVFVLAAIAVVAGAWLDAIEGASGSSRAATVSLAGGVAIATVALLLPIPAPWPSLPTELARPHGHRGLRAAGLWLARSGVRMDGVTVWAPGKGDVVLFYASGKAEPRGQQRKVLASWTVPEVVARMDATAPAYLVVDRLYGHTKPELWRLWTDPSLAPREGLRLVYQADEVRVFTREAKAS
jgi:4-amino-4-deoxy-L-arabinose transferase-like glycosyltransferase